MISNRSFPTVTSIVIIVEQPQRGVSRLLRPLFGRLLTVFRTPYFANGLSPSILIPSANPLSKKLLYTQKKCTHVSNNYREFLNRMHLHCCPVSLSAALQHFKPVTRLDAGKAELDSKLEHSFRISQVLTTIVNFLRSRIAGLLRKKKLRYASHAQHVPRL